MTLRPLLDGKEQQAIKRFGKLSVIVRGMAHKMRPCDEDMLQIGLMKLWELIAGEDEHEDKYLIAAARNAMIDRIRYQKIREREKKVTDLLHVAEPVQQESAGEAQLDTDIEDLLSLLPKHLSKAFRLHVFQEYTLAETGKILNRPVSTVANWIGMAKAFLKKELE